MARDTSFDHLGGEPDYEAPALEEDTTSVARDTVAAKPAPAAPAKKRTRYEQRLNEYREKVYWPEFNRKIAREMKRYYPAIPADAPDDEVIARYKTAFAADMPDEDFYAKLGDVYASDWTPSVPEPEMSLLEQGEALAPHVPKIAGEMGKAAIPFVGAAVGQAVSKIPGVGQLGLLANTGVKMLGQMTAGQSLEKTASEMPEPNVQALIDRGYSDAQIANVLKGYADVQRELYGEMEQIGREGVGTAAEGIANAATFGMTMRGLEKAAAQLTGQGLARAGAKGAVGSVVSKAAGHTATGAVTGGAYEATREATERMAQAKAAGLGADDIWKAGVEGGWHGATSGAVLGALVGGTLGVPIGAVSTGVEIAKAGSAARKAVAARAAQDALDVNLNRFADDFRPHELAQRFPEDLAAAAGDDALLAQNIVKGVWGPEVAASEAGLRAATRLYDKINTWRGAREQLNGTMIDLPAAPPQALPVMPPIAQALPEGTPMGAAPVPGMVGAIDPLAAPPFAPPADVPQMPDVQPGAMLPEQVPPGAMPASIAPVEAPQMPASPMGPSVGVATAPIIKGPSMEPPAPVEYAPRLPAQVEPQGIPSPEPVVPARPEPAIEPRPVEIPTHAGRAIERFGDLPNVKLSTSGDGKHLTIERLGVTAGTLAKPGASSDALAHVAAVADEAGIPVEAYITPQAGPRGGKIPLEKLIPWYEQHGYAVTSQGDDWVTVRREPALPSVAERVKDLDPEQAHMAAGNVQLGRPMMQWDDAQFDRQLRTQQHRVKDLQRRNEALGQRIGDLLTRQAEAARARIQERGTRLYAMGLDLPALADHAIIVAAEMFTKGMRTKTAVSNWLTETYGEGIRPHIDAIYERAQKRLTRMFRTDARAAKKLQELVELRDAGSHGKDWYEETAQWVGKTFGDDADMFLRFLAVTSADGSTEAGAALAMKAFAQWKQGLPFDGMRGPHMVKMLEDSVRSEKFGGDKINSFYKALRGDENAVVIDRWMMRALGLPARAALTPQDYKLYERIVRDLAADGNMTPRQFQAAVWEGARVGDLHKRWKAGGAMAASKVGSARPLETILQREFGNQTPYQWIENNQIKHETLAAMSAGMKQARAEGGFTFNPQTWEADKTPGFVVTLASDVVPRGMFYPAALTKFKNQFQDLISTSAFGGPHVNVGVFDLGKNNPGHYSLDFNVVIPDGPGAREKAIAIGKANRQFSIGQIDPEGNFTEHKTGYSPKKHGPQFVPPSDPKRRAAWFKAAKARASTLIDQVEFRMTSPEAPAAPAPKPVAKPAPKAQPAPAEGTSKARASMLDAMKKLRKKGEDELTGRFRRSGAPVWLGPDGGLYEGASHEAVALKAAKAAGLNSKKVGYKGNYRWENHALLQEGFIRVQVQSGVVNAQVVGVPNETQRKAMGALLKGRRFAGVVSARDGSSESEMFDSWTKLLRHAEQK